MTTTVKICNSALVSLGANTINSLTQNSVEANQCNAKWDIVRREELRAHPWNFAIKRVQLPTVSGDDPAFRYDYRYQVPSDNLRILKVYDNIDYKLERRTIITNKDSCYIKYIYDNDQPETWDSSFVGMVVARMALELAYVLPGARTMIETMWNLYKHKGAVAMAIDASEDYMDEIGQGDDSLVTARYE